MYTLVEVSFYNYSPAENLSHFATAIEFKLGVLFKRKTKENFFLKIATMEGTMVSHPRVHDSQHRQPSLLTATHGLSEGIPLSLLPSAW